MKFIILSFLSLVVTTSLLAESDFQTISDEGQSEVSNIAENIKTNLRNAITQEGVRSVAKNKILKNPSIYDTEAIKKEWDEIIAELRAGLFCHECRRSKKQIENETDEDFYKHAARNGGVISAPQSAYDEANKKYEAKLRVAQEIVNTYETARNERVKFIMNALNLKAQLHSKIQLAYDFQMKAYYPVKSDAKEYFSKLSSVFIKQDSIISMTTPGSAEYKNYVIQRYETTEEMDSGINELNQQRMEFLKEAEAKKVASLAEINEIRELAKRVGTEESPSGFVIESGFNYVPTRDVYLLVRMPEKLERFLTAEVFSLYSKVKVEGRN